MTFPQKEFEGTKGVIRINKSKKDRQHNGQKKGTRTNNDLKTLHRKLKIEQHEAHSTIVNKHLYILLRSVHS